MKERFFIQPVGVVLALLGMFFLLPFLSSEETMITIKKPTEKNQIQQGPPQDMEEIVPITPWVDRTWIKGHWKWHQNRWKWQRGHMAIMPREKAIWVSGHWIKKGDQWVWIYGYWKE